METFVIASNNPNKVQELNRILNPMGITAKTANRKDFHRERKNKGKGGI